MNLLKILRYGFMFYYDREIRYKEYSLIVSVHSDRCFPLIAFDDRLIGISITILRFDFGIYFGKTINTEF